MNHYEIKFYKCKHCGNIVAMFWNSGIVPHCCGEQMNVLEANTSDGAIEKHVPVVSMEGDVCTVKVGSVNHPMSEEHWIEWILIKTEKGIQRKILTPGDAPMAKFALIGDRVLETYAYCNLHGLWKA